jgi:acyl carrier protein
MNADPTLDDPSADALREIIARVAAVPSDAIHLEARLVEDLGMDSLNAAEAGIAAEQAGLFVDQDAWWKSRTFGDLVKATRS